MSPRNGHRLLGVLFAVAAAVFLWQGLGRPALWIDECASAFAIQRSWGSLFHLLSGPDAPHVPYYALLKVVTHPFPDALRREHAEEVYRWPSVVAMSVGTGLLVSWLARRGSVALAAVTGVLLMATAGFSRFGQEARPYAFSLLVAVVATLAWARLVTDPRRRFVLLYALAVAALVLPNVFTATLVAAHLLAALVVPLEGSRARTVARTAAGAVLGLLLVSPLVLETSRNGTGPRTSATPSASWLWDGVSDLFSVSARAPWAVSAVVVLAALGLLLLGSRQYGFLARLALCWAVVPMLVLLPAVLARPGLLKSRYLVFVLPGWALLAALGVTAVARAVLAGLDRAGPRPAAAGLAGLAGVAVLAVTLWSQLPSLHDVREPDGHGENVRPVMAWAARPENAGLPIVSSGRADVFLAAYRSPETGRLVGSRMQHDGVRVWPAAVPAAAQLEQLRSQPQVLLMRRANGDPDCTHRRPREKLNGFITRCLPEPLAELGYRVVRSRPSGKNWVVAVLDRPA